MPRASPIYFQESCAFPLGQHELDKISAVPAMMANPLGFAETSFHKTKRKI